MTVLELLQDINREIQATDSAVLDMQIYFCDEDKKIAIDSLTYYKDDVLLTNDTEF